MAPSDTFQKLREKAPSTGSISKPPSETQTQVKEAQTGYRYDIERARANRASPSPVEVRSPRHEGKTRYTTARPRQRSSR